jgi:hypothetical protein
VNARPRGRNTTRLQQATDLAALPAPENLMESIENADRARPAVVDGHVEAVHDHRPDRLTVEQVEQIRARVAFGRLRWWQRLVTPAPEGWPG